MSEVFLVDVSIYSQVQSSNTYFTLYRTTECTRHSDFKCLAIFKKIKTKRIQYLKFRNYYISVDQCFCLIWALNIDFFVISEQ